MLAQGAEKPCGMSFPVVLPNCVNAVEKRGCGESQMQERHAAEAEPVCRLNRSGGDGHAQQRRQDADANLAQCRSERRPRLSEVHAIKRQQCRREEQQRGEFRKYSQCGEESKRDGAHPIWSFGPVNRAERCRPREGRQRHIGRHKAGVAEHCGHSGKDQGRKDRASRSCEPPRAEKNDCTGDPEKRQHRQPEWPDMAGRRHM